jgi:hypothetical protein
VTVQPGDVVRGRDVTGLSVIGTVLRVHHVDARDGPYGGGPVAVVDVPLPGRTLLALVRTYEITHSERAI